MLVEDLPITKFLEESVFDMAAVLEVPSLLVIPRSLTQPLVVLSQSFLYEPLCHMKDLLKLQNCKNLSPTHQRLSKIPNIL